MAPKCATSNLCGLESGKYRDDYMMEADGLCCTFSLTPCHCMSVIETIDGGHEMLINKQCKNAVVKPSEEYKRMATH